MFAVVGLESSKTLRFLGGLARGGQRVPLGVVVTEAGRTDGPGQRLSRCQIQFVTSPVEK